MNIKDKINKAFDAFIVLEGKEPNKIYLGKKELDALLEWAYENSYVISTEIKRTGLEVLGMKVYEVKEDSHFNLSV